MPNNKTNIAINGLGRIGRAFLKIAITNHELDIIAVNDLGDRENIAYLLKYDSVYGTSKSDIRIRGKNLVIDGKEISFLNEKNPGNLPWREMEIDIVVEATGVFASYEKSKAHIEAGAKRVVISAPVKDEPGDGMVGATVLLGINEDKLKNCDISSNASCTTNAASPVIQILSKTVGVEKALLNTVHGYTASQEIVDLPSAKDFRRGRAAAVNIIPATTGAAVSVTKAVTSLEGNFDGIALRVPVISGSIADITFVSKKDTSAKEINEIFKKATNDDVWKGILSVTDEPIVSTDIIGSPYGAIVDLSFTRVVGGNLCKVLSWYDNEMGYAHTLVKHVIKSAYNL